MAEMKTFRTIVVLTLATGTGMGEGLTTSDLHELIQHLSGGEVYNHQLHLLFDEGEAAAIAAIGDAWVPFEIGGDHQAYAADMIAKLGETMDIAPAAKPFHREDAIHADAVEFFGGDPSNVIVIGGERG